MAVAAILAMRALAEKFRDDNRQTEEDFYDIDVITRFAEGTRPNNPDFVSMFPEADMQQLSRYTDFTQQFADGLNLVAMSHGTIPDDITLVKNEAPYVDVDIKTSNITISTGHIKNVMAQEQVRDPMLSGVLFSPDEAAYLTGVKAGAHLELATSQPNIYAAIIDHPQSIVHLDNPLEEKVQDIVTQVAVRLQEPQTMIDAHTISAPMQEYAQQHMR